MYKVWKLLDEGKLVSIQITSYEPQEFVCERDGYKLVSEHEKLEEANTAAAKVK